MFLRPLQERCLLEAGSQLTQGQTLSPSGAGILCLGTLQASRQSTWESFPLDLLGPRVPTAPDRMRTS